jgi:hypothetical protein
VTVIQVYFYLYTFRLRVFVNIQFSFSSVSKRIRCTGYCPWIRTPNEIQSNLSNGQNTTIHVHRWDFRFSQRQVAVFWDVASCSLVDSDQRFRGAYCLHHQGNDGGSTLLWNIGQHLPDYMVQHPRRQSSSCMYRSSGEGGHHGTLLLTCFNNPVTLSVVHCKMGDCLLSLTDTSKLSNIKCGLLRHEWLVGSTHYSPVVQYLDNENWNVYMDIYQSLITSVPETVSEMSDFYYASMWLIVIAFSCHENFIVYIFIEQMTEYCVYLLWMSGTVLILNMEFIHFSSLQWLVISSTFESELCVLIVKI